MSPSSAFQEATKEQFKQMYLEHGRATDGWSEAYWNDFYEAEISRPVKYMLEMPASAEHDRLMIVSDYAVGEHRMFFITEDQEEDLLGGQENAREPQRDGGATLALRADLPRRPG